MARTRKSIATHRTIASAALGIAKRRGPDSVTAAGIAAEAGVSLRTVYNHFPSVSHAILGIDPDQPERSAARLLERPESETPLQALAAAVIGRGVGPTEWRDRAGLARGDPALYAAWMSSLAILDDRLTDAMAQRLGVDPRQDPYPRLVVTAGQAAMRAATEFAIQYTPVSLTEDQVLEHVLLCIEQALVLLESGLSGYP
jgi:AcrR family transcriptional regulator